LPPLLYTLIQNIQNIQNFSSIFYRDLDKKKTVHIYIYIYTRADVGQNFLDVLDVLDKLYFLLGKVQQIHRLGALNFGYGFGWASIFG
jgi:hypothetical protein